MLASEKREIEFARNCTAGEIKPENMTFVIVFGKIKSPFMKTFSIYFFNVNAQFHLQVSVDYYITAK